MKKRSLLIAITCLFVTLSACKKDKSKSITNPEVLTASQTSGIEKGEPVLFTLAGAPIGSTVNWSVSPTTAQLNTTNSDTIESVLFTQPGQYTVTATVGSVILTSIVTVNDTSYVSPSDPSYNPNWNNFYDTVSVSFGLSVTPIVVGDSLALYAITDNSYNCINNYLNTSVTNYGPPMVDWLVYTVAIPKNSGCLGGSKRAASVYTIFVPADNSPHNFGLQINDAGYGGTVTRSSDGNTYTFTWPSINNNIILSPLTVTK